MLRPERGRLVAGVCAGLAAHLGAPVKMVRVVMALLGLAGGAGVALYLFWWVTIPPGDPRAAARAALPADRRRLAPGLDLSAIADRVRSREVLLGFALIGGASALIAARLGWNWQRTWTIPVVLAVGGLALAWSRGGAAQSAGSAAAEARPGWRMWIRPLGGTALLMAGVLIVLAQETPGWAVFQAGIAALAVLLGVALMLAPWWLRLARELGDARAERAREAERADIAAHLHDSVLQTLALIRSQASDADAVARMARAQERELREWMYEDRPAQGTSLASELRAVIAQVEDGHRGRVGGSGDLGPVAIDSVVVGDCTPTEATRGMLQATREALVNAAAHGLPPISVYAEFTSSAAEVYVRDRGEGFELDSVAADRFGVRESIIGRMTRRGGSAEIVSRPGWGTEVRLRLPLSDQPIDPEPNP